MLEEQVNRLHGELIELLSGEQTDETAASLERKRSEVVKIRARLKSVKSELAQVDAAQANRTRQQEVAKLQEAVASRDAQLQALNEQLAAFEREREQPVENAELRIFRLKFLDARSASKSISDVVGVHGVRTSVDVRANALIVSAPLDKIEVIGALLENLDVENGGGAKAQAKAGPRSLLVRVFWLADNLPEGEGQDPADYLPGSVLKAVKGVGLESPRIVSQIVNSAVNVMGDGQSPPFLTSTSVLIGGQRAKEMCRGTLRVAGDREVVLQLSMQVENSCQIEGNLTMPIGHYMVLGTANAMIPDPAVNPPSSDPPGGGMDGAREFEGAAQEFGGRGGFDGGRGGRDGGRGGFGMAAPEMGGRPTTFKTSRFAFVVQVVEAESFAPEADM